MHDPTLVASAADDDAERPTAVADVHVAAGRGIARAGLGRARGLSDTSPAILRDGFSRPRQLG
jgi:hypothetical protein